MKIFLSVCLVSTFLVSLTPVASACSVAQSCPNELKLGSELPSQAKGVVWDLGYPTDDPGALKAHVTLREVGGEQSQELDVDVSALPKGGEFLIVPTGGFEPQSSYEIEVTFPDFITSQCEGNHGTSSRTFDIVELTAVSPPTLTAGEATRGPHTFAGGPECSREEEAVYTEVNIQWPSPLADVRDALEVELLIDGERSYISASDDSFTLAASCEAMSQVASGLAEGDHEVIVRATLPDTSTSWESAPLTVPLHCQESQSGCHTSAAAPASPPVEWLLLGLGFFALHRRRRNRNLLP